MCIFVGIPGRAGRFDGRRFKTSSTGDRLKTVALSVLSRQSPITTIAVREVVYT